MIEQTFSTLNEWLYESYSIAIMAAFGWGILSILLSPCHLSSIPLVIGFINSQGKITLKRTFLLSLIFAVGILITIAAIGIITASLGRIIGDVGKIGNYLVSLIFFVIGFYLLDLIPLPWNGIGISPTKLKGLLAAFVLGLLFGIGLGPCTFAYMAPVLGVVFKVSSSNILFAIILMFAFGIGHCSVIIGAGTATKKLQLYLNWTENSKVTLLIKRICGILVILGGIYILFNT